MSRLSRAIGFGGAGLLVVAGTADAIGFPGTLGQLLALLLIGLGLVLATGLVFYEVGLSEDRERAREERERERPVRRQGRPRPRLKRRRGQRRRL